MKNGICLSASTRISCCVGRSKGLPPLKLKKVRFLGCTMKIMGMKNLDVNVKGLPSGGVETDLRIRDKDLCVNMLLILLGDSCRYSKPRFVCCLV